MLSLKNLLITALFLCLGGTAVAYNDFRNTHVDSLEAMLRSPHPPKGEELIRAYMELARGYEVRDGQRCLEYAQKALALSYEINALRARQNALYYLGLTAYGRDDWDSAVDYFLQSLAVIDTMRQDRRYTESDVDDCLSQLYGALGNVYNMQDKAHLAINYYQRALPIFERYGWLESQTILYYNVGELYLSMGNMTEAERNYSLASEKANEAGDSLMMGTSWSGLLKIYLDKDYEQARKIAEAAYTYFHTHRSELPGAYANLLASIVRLHLMKGHEDVKKARAYADEALEIERTAEMMSEDRCNIYAAACEVAMHEKRWHEALAYGLKSVYDDSVITYNDASCQVLLAQIFTELGDKDSARVYINKVYNLMQRFATEHYQSGLSQMEVLYETEKKQAAIEQLQEQRRWMMWGTILGGLILLLVAVLFFVLWRSVRLSKRTALIKAKLDGELEERVRIARDLHDRLGGLLTALKLKLAEFDDAEMEKPRKLTDEAIHEMRNISHHLLPDSLRRYGLRTALRDYCETMPHVSFSFVGDDVRVEHEEVIYCIVYELVNNAVKSAEAAHIRVQVITDQEYIAVNVSDDGNGRFSFEQASEGSGLRNIQERVRAIGGTINAYSKEGKGTEINVEIPRKV